MVAILIDQWVLIRPKLLLNSFEDWEYLCHVSACPQIIAAVVDCVVHLHRRRREDPCAWIVNIASVWVFNSLYLYARVVETQPDKLHLWLSSLSLFIGA